MLSNWFYVTNNRDSGDHSLRAAIDDANTTANHINAETGQPEPDIIVIQNQAVGFGDKIDLSTPLPTISQGVKIYTETTTDEYGQEHHEPVVIDYRDDEDGGRPLYVYISSDTANDDVILKDMRINCRGTAIEIGGANLDKFTIEDCSTRIPSNWFLSHDGTAAVSILNGVNADSGKITNCSFWGKEDGIRIGGTVDDLEIDGNEIARLSRQNVVSHTVGDPDTETNGIEIRDTAGGSIEITGNEIYYMGREGTQSVGLSGNGIFIDGNMASGPEVLIGDASDPTKTNYIGCLESGSPRANLGYGILAVNLWRPDTNPASIAGNKIRYNGVSGVTLLGCHYINVTDNTISNNEDNGIEIASPSISYQSTQHITVQRNTLQNNDDAGILLRAEDGRHIQYVTIGDPDEGGAGDGICGANEISSNGGAGIEIAALGDTDSMIEGVTIAGDYTEFIEDTEDEDYPGPQQKWIHHNADHGVWAHVYFEGQDKARIESLVIEYAGIGSNGGYGIRLEGPEGYSSQGQDAVVRSNCIGIDPASGSNDYGNTAGGILLGDDTVGANIEGNFIAYSGTAASPAPGIRIDDADCDQNLLSQNGFYGNSGSPIVLASDSQGGLADATPVIGGIAQTPTGWSVPVTLSTGSTFADCDFTAQFYAYNATTKHYYVLTDDDNPIEATAAESGGSVTIRGEIDLDEVTIPSGYELCALVYCSDETEPSLVDNTTVFSASRAVPTVRVVDEYVFYNDSVWDEVPVPDPNPGYDYDNDAVDPTREALYAGEQATGENVTCYGKGLNGVMIDVVGFTGNTADIDASDFDFYVMDGSGTFQTTSDPTVSVETRMIDTDGDGTAETAGHRIKFIFSDNTASGSWLKIDVLASGDVGLDADHTFYFGNLYGDMTGLISVPPDRVVGSADLDLVRANWGATVTGTDSWQSGDANSDETISSADLDVIRANWGNTLPSFTAPALAMASQSLSTSSTSTWTDAADKVYERYGLLDDDPTNDLAIDAKFWEKLYKALGLTYTA